MYKTYITTNNLEPEKAYVGMTGTNNPNYLGSGRYFVKALKKVGKENFTRIDLGETEYADEAHYWEGFYIKVLKTMVNEGGYNICSQGGSVSKRHSEISKNKMSENRKDKAKGIPFTAEHRLKISEALKGKVRSKEHIANHSASLKGSVRSLESRKKQSDSLKGRAHSLESREKQSASIKE